MLEIGQVRVGFEQEGFRTIHFKRKHVAVINIEQKRAKNHVRYMGAPLDMLPIVGQRV